MRYSEIDEMIGGKKFQNMTSQDIEKYFRGGLNSVKLLGSGMHAVALQIGNEVYKFWLLDSAYEAFAKYCLSHQDNKFLPKFHGDIRTMPAFFLRHEGAPDVIKYVKMEKLNSTNLNNHSWEVHPEFQDPDEEDEWSSYRYVKFETVVSLCQTALFKDLQGLTDALSKLANQRIPYDSKTFDPELTLLVNKQMDIIEFNEQYRLDLHGGNVMARGDQLVILDPIAYEKDVNINNEFLKFAARPEGKRTGGKTASRTSRSPSTDGKDLP